jgi:hypothetical protein
MCRGGTVITDSSTPHSLFSDLTHELSRYTRGEITLQTFHSWFAPVLWKIEASGEPNAEELAYDIALRLSEYSQGQCTEPQLKTILHDLAHMPTGSTWRDDDTRTAT